LCPSINDDFNGEIITHVPVIDVPHPDIKSISEIFVHCAIIEYNATPLKLEGTSAMKLLAYLLLSVFIVLFIACGGESTIAPSEPPQSIEIFPADAGVALGYSYAFTATGIYADGSKRDLTDDVIWESNDTGIAVFHPGSPKGSADTIGKGAATITAGDGNISGTATLTVTDAELSAIEIDPPIASIPTGLTENYTATGIFSDKSQHDLTTQVTWNSSDPGVAIIEPDGTVSAIADGSTIITASSETVSATATLEVYTAALESIALVPTATSIALGNDQQFTATGTYSDSSAADITGEALWKSSDTNVATLSNDSGSEGLAATHNTGTTDITASLESVTSPVSTLTVTSATLESIAVTPPMPSVIEGASVGFTATGTYSDGSTADITASVIWSSSDTGIAAISNASGSEGVATSVAPGTTLITAVSGNISAETTLTVTQNALQSISVDPENQTVLLSGTSVNYTATGHYANGSQSDLTKHVNWSSSNIDVATISNSGANSGIADTHGSGTTTIEAEYEDITGTATLQVLL
jgi:hypothetical protein